MSGDLAAKVTNSVDDEGVHRVSFIVPTSLEGLVIGDSVLEVVQDIIIESHDKGQKMFEK